MPEKSVEGDILRGMVKKGKRKKVKPPLAVAPVPHPQPQPPLPSKIIDFGMNLYEQIPSYKILDDLDESVLDVFVTESLLGKISEISFIANNYVLISKTADMFKPNNNRPTFNWFVPLSNAEKRVQWREISLKDPTGEIERQLGESASFAWQLDFSHYTPVKWQ